MSGDIDGDLPTIGKPARRALATIGVTRLEQVAAKSERELLALHGFGPKALRILQEALNARGWRIGEGSRAVMMGQSDQSH